MIKVHFFDWNVPVLDVEKELGIDKPVDEFLCCHVTGIRFDSTDNEADMENNWIYWFSADDESRRAEDMRRLIDEQKVLNSSMGCSVTVV